MKTEQLYDCAGITLNSNEVFEFICCDCGLKHHMVMVSEDNKPIGFAVKRVKRPISEGGKLMPPVPTRAMSNAGKHYLKGADTTFERELAEGVYQVMFAVAPVVALGGEKGEPPCNPHPDAPHGYNRNASHNAGRYVCDCEGWAALGGEKGEAG